MPLDFKTLIEYRPFIIRISGVISFLSKGSILEQQ
jgi:hypothetical protein